MYFELYLKRPRAWAWPLLLLEAIEARWCGAADEADAACAVAAARVGLEKDLVRGVLVHTCSTHVRIAGGTSVRLSERSPAD